MDDDGVDVLGVDVGGTKVAVRVEGTGRPADQRSFRWPPAGDPERDVAALAEDLTALRQRRGAPIAAVGVAMPATVDPGGRVAAWPGRPSWTGFDLGAALGRLFPGVPVGWADDGDLAGLAEAREAGHSDLLYLGVGTGVGGGIVLGGRLQPGAEVGHVVIDRSGAFCDCGRRGCLQAAASGPATLRRAGELRGGPVAYPELAAAWSAGERWAALAVGEACEALAVAAVGVGELLRPSLVLIGGGFPAGLPGYVDEVAGRVARWARPGHPPVPVGPAVLGGLSSLYGAVALAYDLAVRPPGQPALSAASESSARAASR